MNQLLTTGIVLTRTDYQEANRIVTLLTPDKGKVRVIAKGVRKPKSKLAGGIELFSVSDISYIQGRGDLGTLISTRLITHYDNIVKDINRTMLGYEFLKRMNRLTEDAAGEEYYLILNHSLKGLDDDELSIELAELWFTMQLLDVTGHLPNLTTDNEGKKLDSESQFLFDSETMTFRVVPEGPFTANHIKLLRLAQGTDSPLRLKQLKNAGASSLESLRLATMLLKLAVRI